MTATNAPAPAPAYEFVVGAAFVMFVMDSELPLGIGWIVFEAEREAPGGSEGSRTALPLGV